MKKINIFLQIIFITVLIFCNGFIYAEKNAAKNSFSGIGEANLRYLSPQVGGYLRELITKRGQNVKKGDLLFVMEQVIEQSDLMADREEFEKNQKTIEGYIILEKIREEQLKRRVQLSSGKYIAQDEIDDVRAELQNTRVKIIDLQGQLKIIQARLKKLDYMLNKQNIFAPDAGIVQDTFYRSGEYVAPGRPVVTLYVPVDMRVVFYVPYEIYTSLKMGDKVYVQVAPNVKSFPAKITFIRDEAEYTPPIMYSKEERNQLVFEIEATPSKEDALKVHPGQPVTVFW